MVNLEQLQGKDIAVWLVIKNADGSTDQWWFDGPLAIQDDRIVVSRGDAGPPFKLSLEMVEKIEPCNETQKEAFEGCDYFIRLMVGPLPDDMDRTKLEYSGLTLPKDNEA